MRRNVEVVVLAILVALAGYLVIKLPAKLRPATPDGNAARRDQALALNAAQDRWRARAPADYQFTITKSCFCVVRPVTVTVRGGAVVRLVYADDGTAVDSAGSRGVVPIDSMFGFLRQTIAEKPSSFVAWYDSEFGYPVSVSVVHEAFATDNSTNTRISDFAIPGTPIVPPRRREATAERQWLRLGNFGHPVDLDTTGIARGPEFVFLRVRLVDYPRAGYDRVETQGVRCRTRQTQIVDFYEWQPDKPTGRLPQSERGDTAWHTYVRGSLRGRLVDAICAYVRHTSR